MMFLAAVPGFLDPRRNERFHCISSGALGAVPWPAHAEALRQRGGTPRQLGTIHSELICPSTVYDITTVPHLLGHKDAETTMVYAHVLNGGGRGGLGRQGAPVGKSFIECVEHWANRGFVPPNGRAWVDYIRTKGLAS